MTGSATAIKTYPLALAFGDDLEHAWQPDGRARCGTRIEACPVVGRFDPHTLTACRSCSSLVIDERMPGVRL